MALGPAGGAPRGRALLAILALQVVLLSIGITRDYRLKHEDNNALHATFARSHLRLGLGVTKAQNYFYSPATGTGRFYAHHPPGPSLVLAAVYGVTGADGPVATRGTAILFHVLATWLFFGLARRVLAKDWEVWLAAAFFVVLPESAFFGRMMNHEVLALPPAILLVTAYWEAIRGDWATRRWMPALIGASVWAAVSGWVGFFPIAACVAHGTWEATVRRNVRARAPLAVLIVCGGVLLGADLAHLVWVLGGDIEYLGRLLSSRMSTDAADGVGPRLARILELHWRYFGATSLVALGALAWRTAGGLRRGGPRDPAVEVGSLFLLAGAAYVAVFNVNAARHDYWQFPLLPASAIGLVLIVRWLLSGLRHGRRRAVWAALVGLVFLDVAASSLFMLSRRHGKTEGYCLTVVEQLRRNNL